MDERERDRTGAEASAQSTTRRRGVGTGLRLVAAGTATLGALPLGAATAQGNDDRDRRDQRERALERALEAREEALRRAQERLEARLADRRNGADVTLAGSGRAMPLCRVEDVNGDDFNRDNRGGDRLTRGALRVERGTGNGAGRLHLRLNGAVQNTTYEVVFLRFRDGQRTTLGRAQTDGAGDVRGPVRSGANNTGDEVRLSGNNRVGIFVLTRDGKDQFVTCLVTQRS